MTVNLVTGADGFVGQHLVGILLERGEDVVGAVRRNPPQLVTLGPAEAAKVHWAHLELEERDTVRTLIREGRADRIFHLAGLASVADSLHDPVAPLRVNAIGSLYLLEELAELRRRDDYDPVVVFSGSAEVYGTAANRFKPLTEDCPLEPLSPYAVSKAAQEMLGTQAHRADGIRVIVTRSFNHTGPGQRKKFVAAELAARIRQAAAHGGSGKVSVADPTVRRDFTDVRDVARAYAMLAEKGVPGEVYNVCSGRSYAVGELLEQLLEITGIDVEVEPDPQRKRRVDIPELVGDYTKLAAATGWAPEFGLRASLADLYARQDVEEA